MRIDYVHTIKDVLLFWLDYKFETPLSGTLQTHKIIHKPLVTPLTKYSLVNLNILESV